MKVIFPVTIGDDQFVSSSLDEDEAAAYDAGHAYSALDRVIYDHYVYEALEGPGGAHTGHTPPITGKRSDDWWTKVSPTNQRAMFDNSSSTKSISPTNTLTVVIKPGVYVTSMELLATHATKAVITGRNGLAGSIVYGPVTVNLDETYISNHWEYSFAPYRWATQKLIDGLPMYLNLHITVELTHESDSVCWIGGLVVGSIHDLGDIKRDSEDIGAKTYSGIDTNTFGSTDITHRDSAKEMSNTLLIPIASVERVYALMIDLFDTPAVWVEPNDSMRTIFGIQTSFRMKPQDVEFWTCEVQYMGFT